VGLPAIGKTGVYRLPAELNSIELGVLIVVEGPRGTALGEVRSAPTPGSATSGGTIRRVLRRATSGDLAQQRKAEAREDEAFRKALQLMRTTSLDGRLIAVHADGIAETMSVCVAAEVRQDVKKFARELGRSLGMRTLVRQVSRREASARLAGVGRCGRALCCSTFLTDFPATNIRTAKDQYMALSPESVQGQCGGTLCCLAYEHGDYLERSEWLPKMGKKARTTTGLAGRVVGVNALQMTFVLLDEQRQRHVLAATEWEGNRGKDVPAPDAEQDRCGGPSRTSPQGGGLAESAAPEENST
jgi:cell fate regulator YaaT (PSP1 superfamily)